MLLMPGRIVVRPRPLRRQLLQSPRTFPSKSAIPPISRSIAKLKESAEVAETAARHPAIPHNVLAIVDMVPRRADM
jgi:hypothetical protein